MARTMTFASLCRANILKSSRKISPPVLFSSLTSTSCIHTSNMTKAANMAYQAKYGDAGKAIPRIKVFFLQASRSIRTAWLLEELGLPYEVEFADRENQKAPKSLKEACGNPLGKFPTLKDGDMTVYESGAITDYLCNKYDTTHRLIPTDPYLRNRVQTFVHAAEGTIMIHALAVLYARWNFPAALKETNPEALQQLEAGLGVNVQNDLDWLEAELGRSTGNFLVGNQVTAADTMMHMSARFTLERKLGVGDDKKWPRVEAWLERCENTDTYKAAVEKTGHKL